MRTRRFGPWRWKLLLLSLLLVTGCNPGGSNPVVIDGVDGGTDGGEALPADGGDTDPGSPDAGTDAGDTVPDGGEEPPRGLRFGYPVYTREEIDAWSTASPEYTALARSWAGNVSRPLTPYGAELDAAERDRLNSDSVHLKVQAVLFAADGDPARKAKVAELLDGLHHVTGYAWDEREQYRLVAGWTCTNLAQAAALTGYAHPGFTRFLLEVCYPILDWTAGPNWHASFADSKLAIAAYVGDEALWEDAKAYFNQRIAQSFYHSEYDGETVRPILNDRGAPHLGLTRQHWGGGFGAPQIHDDYTPVRDYPFPDGVNAERLRDLGHVNMGIGAFLQGARTIVAQGDTLEPHAYARLLTGYAHHGDRTLAYLQTGTIPTPDTYRGDGGNVIKQAWLGACRFFGEETPPSVVTLCAHPDVLSYSPAGANHLVAERFADEG
jgi:hypothetical protein